ncbi:RNA methyltransferase [Alcaligenes faecalis]|uniref:TrmH family RNA methyltransferase n=1 Tax=Alcaligenes faecalis TaxID=511 RepID=UPI0010CA4CB7|nr:RNA methyltransferase [Alcaligenes faecalis]QCP80844.1 RNA methyltransferase [Alcaligenes faecalis]ULH05114.1 RNA methyltransferase [Alcaligenes faecalis]UUO09476.1 RNA methyltransferase [Alcaligenes faecalis]
MRLIESKDNALFKRVQRLAHDKRELDGGDQLIWLEGIHLCQMWLERRGLPELAVFEMDRHSDELLELARFLPGHSSVTFNATLMNAVSQVGQGQGIGFIVRVPRGQTWTAPTKRAILLDQVQDPGNVGTVLRTAVAVGLEAVYLTPGCASVWSQKVLRSAQGAHFSIQIHEQVDGVALLEQAALPVLVTSLGPNTQDLYESSLPDQGIWVFGNEGQGVCPALLAKANQRLFIPQAPGVESLNVAIATALCLYEQRRQHSR